MPVDLSDDETAALLRELDHIIDGDRFPLSLRIRILSAIRDKLRPAAARARAVGAAEGLCAATSGSPTPMRTEPGPPMTLGGG